nr:MAG TPA: Protein of unknown function (DUF1056) [Caudoviricetes sp.]
MLAKLLAIIMCMICVFGGMALTVYGCAMIYPPLGYIVSGLLLWRYMGKAFMALGSKEDKT